jgi:hypothetical protein
LQDLARRLSLSEKLSILQHGGCEFVDSGPVDDCLAERRTHFRFRSIHIPAVDAFACGIEE